MAWSIELSGLARKQLKAMDRPQAQRILDYLYQRVALLDDPRSIGDALHGPRLGNYWKYRVGEYRVIAQIDDGRLRILVLRVGNRREVYR
ncbi:MAG: type II toxin-antitoxin system RelE/ParE family toxin [Serpentinimonas sp.]|nr:type II toxin-antitoxin system RelE/ParE family toxin [Serpentinimonas sp.]MDO9611701.1 type II toxin-antitoxin system RelE/ParE family toxin [Serpentinimonas sp.]